MWGSASLFTGDLTAEKSQQHSDIFPTGAAADGSASGKSGLEPRASPWSPARSSLPPQSPQREGLAAFAGPPSPGVSDGGSFTSGLSGSGGGDDNGSARGRSTGSGKMTLGQRRRYFAQQSKKSSIVSG